MESYGENTRRKWRKTTNMEYVIKEVKSNAHYVVLQPGSTFFNVAFKLEDATRFISMEAAVDAIITQSQKQSVTLPRFTIVGVNVITTPQYEEVVL